MTSNILNKIANCLNEWYMPTLSDYVFVVSEFFAEVVEDKELTVSEFIAWKQHN